MATKPECPYCGRTTGLRQVHEGCGTVPAEYTCEGCFTASDTGPCFDDLPVAPVTMTPREAGEAAFYECEGNNAACLKAAFDAYEAATAPFAWTSLAGWKAITAGREAFMFPASGDTAHLIPLYAPQVSS